MRSKKDNFAYIGHIKESIDKIVSYTSSHTRDKFDNSEWDQAAVTRYLEIIGEAANNIEDTFREGYSHLQWRRIINLRNIIVHDYIDVDINIVWTIITQDIPLLEKEIDLIIKDNPVS